MKKVTLKIDGMTCGGCVSSVEKALAGIDGVTSSKVWLETGIATVEVADNVAVEVLCSAIEDAGFDVAVQE